MDSTLSPWWYRRREVVIGLLYLVAFGIGNSIWASFTGSSPTLFGMARAHFGPGAGTLALALAAVAATACWAIRSWGASYLTTGVVWDEYVHDDRLIVEGPFRYLRNPLYFGNVLLTVAIAVFGTPLTAVLMVVTQVVFLSMLSARESRALADRFGAAYATYARAVPALIPRFTAYDAGTPGRVVAHFSDGARGEWLTGGVAAGLIVVTVVPHHPMMAFWLLFIAGLAVQIGAKVRRRARA